MSFKPFGSVKVEWPGKADGRHLHHPPKGEVFLSSPKGIFLVHQVLYLSPLWVITSIQYPVGSWLYCGSKRSQFACWQVVWLASGLKIYKMLLHKVKTTNQKISRPLTPLHLLGHSWTTEWLYSTDNSLLKKSVKQNELFRKLNFKERTTRKCTNVANHGSQ